MSHIKCGLCGFEFEKGMKICQGCQGEIEYGAGGMAFVFGVLYAGLFGYVFYKLLGFEFESWWGLGIFFSVGFFHACHLFKDNVQTTKRTEK